MNHRLKMGIHGDKKKLARAIGVTTGYISHLLAGRRQGPENIRRNIAAALGYKYDEFLGRGYALLLGYDPDQYTYTFTYLGENTFAQRKQLTGVRDPSLPRLSVVNSDWNAPPSPNYGDGNIQTVRLLFQDSPSLPQSLSSKLAELDEEGLQKIEAWLDGYLAHKQ